MTKREMMVKAHALAKTMVGNYAARLSLALRQIWSELKNIIKCRFEDIEVNLNIKTGALVGNLYHAKETLKHRIYVKWDSVNKNWVITNGPKMTKERMIEIFADKYAV